MFSFEKVGDRELLSNKYFYLVFTVNTKLSYNSLKKESLKRKLIHRKHSMMQSYVSKKFLIPKTGLKLK